MTPSPEQSSLVERLRALSKKATQGTWSWEDGPPTVYAGRVDPIGEFGGMPVCGHGYNLFGRLTDLSHNGRADLDFAVACVNFVRDNIGVLERLSQPSDGVTEERACEQVRWAIERADDDQTLEFWNEGDPAETSRVITVGDIRAAMRSAATSSDRSE